MIEFDVDMGYLLEEGELDCVILNDENGEHEPMEFVPKVGNGTCELTEIDIDNDTASEWMLDRFFVFDKVYKCSCGRTFGHVAEDRPEHCPHCGGNAKVVER